jgi:2-succinyl-6-hydroxy-2,4-cyclohexadiene-1-carboxylate synthase
MGIISGMPEVVFLPGFMQHADSWSQVAAAVGKRYPSRAYEFTTWTAKERIEEIRAAAGPGDVVVGYSMGGRLALHAALGEDVRWGGLVLVGASAGIDDPAAREQRWAEDEALAEWIERSPIEEVVDRWQRNPVFESQDEALVAAQRAGRLAHDPRDLARLLRSAGQGAMAPVWDRLGELPLRVAAMPGELDERYVQAGFQMGKITGGLTVSIAGAGHAPHLERPDAFATALIAWIAREVDNPVERPFRLVHIDRVERFALEIDDHSGRTFVSIPVSNPYAEYEEWYEVDRATFDRFAADPALALPFVERARNRELDHLLLYLPGRLRGYP